MNNERVLRLTIVTSIASLLVAALSLRLGSPAEGVGARVFATAVSGDRAVVQVQVMRSEKVLVFGVPDAKIDVRLDGQKVAQATTDAEGVAYARFPVKAGTHKVQVLDDKGEVIGESGYAWRESAGCAEPIEWPEGRERPSATAMRVEGDSGQALAMDVALFGDALSATFGTQSFVRVFDKASGKGASGATLELEGEGATVLPSSLQTRENGVATFAINPSYHSVVLRVSATVDGQKTDFMASLPVAPAAGDIDLEPTIAERTVVRGHARYATGHATAYLEVVRGSALVHAEAFPLEKTAKGSAHTFILPELDAGLYWVFLSTSPNGADAPPLTLRAQPLLVGRDLQPLSRAYALCGKSMPNDRDEALMRAPRPLVVRKMITDGIISRGTVIRARSATAKRVAVGALLSAVALNLAAVLLLGRKSRSALDISIARSSRWGLAAGVGLAALLLAVIAGLIAGAD